jgi:hypothetical protein
MNENLVIYGGRHQGNYLNDLWVYDTNKKAWYEESNTYERNPLVSGHSLDFYKKEDTEILILFGGRRFGILRYTNEIKYYDLKQHIMQIKEISGLKPNQRSFHSSRVKNNSLFIYGGEKDDEIYTDLWIYNIDDSYWKIVSTSKEPSKSIFGLVFFKGYRMYTLGGLNEKNAIEKKYCNSIILKDYPEWEWCISEYERKFYSEYIDDPFFEISSLVHSKGYLQKSILYTFG